MFLPAQTKCTEEIELPHEVRTRETEGGLIFDGETNDKAVWFSLIYPVVVAVSESSSPGRSLRCCCSRYCNSPLYPFNANNEPNAMICMILLSTINPDGLIPFPIPTNRIEVEGKVLVVDVSENAKGKKMNYFSMESTFHCWSQK